MVYGQLPFADLTSHPSKVNAIISPTYQISYPPVSVPRIIPPPGSDAPAIDPATLASPVDPLAIKVMRACHRRGEKDRPTIAELLDHDFLKPWKREFFLLSVFHFRTTKLTDSHSPLYRHCHAQDRAHPTRLNGGFARGPHSARRVCAEEPGRDSRGQCSCLDSTSLLFFAS